VYSLKLTFVNRPFLEGVLDNCPNYFLSPYYYLIFNIYILKPYYINYNPLLDIIIHTLYYN